MEPVSRRGFTLLVSLFIGSLVAAAFISSKIVTIFGLAVPAGVLAYSVTFAASDIIGEVWGRESASEVVHAGLAAMVVATILAHLAVEWQGAAFWTGQEAFASVIGSTPRIVAASLCAYFVSQRNDVWLFHVLRRLTNGRHLWLRNNLSTMVSQLLDSTIFVTVAFWGVLPVGEIILGQWAAKMLIAALDTPVVYAGVAALRSLGTKAEAQPAT
ncbi:queuosine precursor transporter [Desulfovibrio oxyclinae]|uniref:queuosine precursor transporter n=1 Tax=Desulfovibrio oxyclinae TaxID=63560 RepID=UPI000368B26B|nr:queuosine precursor transporter [Desulfovibrio oxyclinae]